MSGVAFAPDARPLIVGIGGTLRPVSTSQRLMSRVLQHAEAMGAQVQLFSARDIDFPIYAPESPNRAPQVRRYTDALRRASGVVIASPGYHGSVSGLVKNALDYIEDLRGDDRCYLDGRAVGCIAAGAGSQGAVTTLMTLRSIVHTLRGWPTPLGLAIDSTGEVFQADGTPSDAIDSQLRIMARQVLATLH